MAVDQGGDRFVIKPLTLETDHEDGEGRMQQVPVSFSGELASPYLIN